MTKTLLYHCKDPEKHTAHLLEPTRILLVHIGGTASNSSLGIKPGTKLFCLNDKSKAALRNKLSDMKVLITD